MFDPSTNNWSTPTSTGIFTPRWYFATAVANGKIYTMGGMTNNGLPVNIVEVFDPATNTWTTPNTSGVFTARYGLAASAMNGKIYVMGGLNQTPLNTFEVLDPVTNLWMTPTTTGSMNERSGLTLAVVNNAIYAMGGAEKAGKYLAITNINQRFTLDEGAKPGVISLNVNRLNFDTLDYTVNSTLSLMIYNHSANGASIDKVMISGTNSLAFEIVGNSKQTNLPYLLQSGDSIGLTVKYIAPSVTENDSAILNIFFYESVDSIRKITLTGSAHEPGFITLAMPGLNFDTLEYTKDSSITAMAYNSSSRQVSIDSTAITGKDSSEFSISGNTKQASLPYLLQPGDSIGFIITYSAPSSSQDDSATLHIFFAKTPDSIRMISLNGSAKQAIGNGVSLMSERNKLAASIFPNPASSEMRISYSIPKRSEVDLRVFDITGKEIARIAGQELDADSYEKIWNVAGLPSGSYLLKLRACGEDVTKVVEIVK